MEEGCYYPRIYLSDPAFSIPSSFRKQFTLTSLVLVSLPHRCWIVLKHQLQRNMKTLFFLGCIYFMPVRRCTIEFINFSILVVRVVQGWEYRRVAVDNSGGCGSGGAEGEDYLVRGWDAAKSHKSKNRSGFYWGVGGRARGYGHASASSRFGQARMVCNSGQDARVWERTGRR